LRNGAWRSGRCTGRSATRGGSAAGALLPTRDGIIRLRGRWFDLAVPGLERPVPALPTYHPSFLLRAPERKREAWRDLLALAARLARDD